MKYLMLALFMVLSAAAQEKVNFPKPTEAFGIWPGKPLLKEGDPMTTRDGVTRITKVAHPSLEFYKSSKAGPKAPCIIIFPGGGYSILAYDKEGTEVAQWANSLGYHAAILRYSVPGRQRAQALKDAQRAIGLVRSKASKWGINSKQVGVLGFSAGGHLAANVSNNWMKRKYEALDEADKLSCRPDFTVLVYPAYLNKSGDKKSLPSDIKISSKTPPAFIVQAINDYRYVDSALNYCRALKEAKIDAELHIYAKGGHGHGMRPSKDYISKWPKLCARWLKETLK